MESAELPDLPALPLGTETKWAPPDVDEEKLVFRLECGCVPAGLGHGKGWRDASKNWFRTSTDSRRPRTWSTPR